MYEIILFFFFLCLQLCTPPKKLCANIKASVPANLQSTEERQLIISSGFSTVRQPRIVAIQHGVAVHILPFKTFLSVLHPPLWPTL